jgi:uncharacterized protein
MVDAPLAVTAFVMALGLLGTFLPLLPGLPLIWLGAFLFGVSEGFHPVGWTAMIMISLLMGAGIAAKILLPKRGASAAGTPRSSLVVGGVAAVMGFFLIPIVGFPLGGAAGIWLAEYRRTKDGVSAWRSTRGAILGFGLAALGELTAGIGMVLTWLVWALLIG